MKLSFLLPCDPEYSIQFSKKKNVKKSLRIYTKHTQNMQKIFLKKKSGGVSIPIVNFWNLMAGMEAKEEDEEEEEKKEKKEKEKEDNKIGVAEKSFHYCHAWCRFVIAILGLAKGVPFVDLFSCFF